MCKHKNVKLADYTASGVLGVSTVSCTIRSPTVHTLQLGTSPSDMLLRGHFWSLLVQLIVVHILAVP